jgi:hypothetical protein
VRSLEQFKPLAAADALIAEKRRAVLSENVEIAPGSPPWSPDRMANLC